MTVEQMGVLLVLYVIFNLWTTARDKKARRKERRLMMLAIFASARQKPQSPYDALRMAEYFGDALDWAWLEREIERRTTNARAAKSRAEQVRSGT